MYFLGLSVCENNRTVTDQQQNGVIMQCKRPELRTLNVIWMLCLKVKTTSVAACGSGSYGSSMGGFTARRPRALALTQSVLSLYMTQTIAH